MNQRNAPRDKKTSTEIFGLGGNWEIGIRLLIWANSCAGSRFYTIFTWAGLCQRTDTRHTPSHATSSSAKKDDVEIVGDCKQCQLSEFGAPLRISANNGIVVVRTSVLPKDVSSPICLFLSSNCKDNIAITLWILFLREESKLAQRLEEANVCCTCLGMWLCEH